MIKAGENYKVGIYVRLSRDDERMGESVSIENQKLILTKYCEEQRWEIVDIYCDDGISGTSFERPGVQRLIEDAKDGRINLILVKDLSRFGRNYIQVGQYTDYLFPMLGIRFIALNDGVDTINNDNDIMPFKNLFNEFQSKETSKKIKAVRQMHIKSGNYLGPYVPYGYMLDPQNKHRFIVDEVAAENVRKLFRYRCQGYGFRKIAELMNDEHILPPRDYYYLKSGRESVGYRNHLWSYPTVKVMIRNEVYIGHMVQNKCGTISYKNHTRKMKPKSEWVKVENTHEPIIDMETWNACVQIDERNHKARSTKDTKTPNLFSGLLLCSDCGFKMRGHQERHKKADGTVTKYKGYICGNYSRSGNKACTTHMIYETALTEIVINDIQSRAKRVIEDEQKVRQDLLEEITNQNTVKQKADKTLLKATKKRIAELERLTQALYEDKVLGTVPDNVFKSLITRYEAEREEKEITAKELTEKLSQTAQSEKDIEIYLERIRKYVAVESLDREMLLELINCIDIGERKQLGNQKYRDIVIHYNLVDKAG